MLSTKTKINQNPTVFYPGTGPASTGTEGDPPVFGLSPIT